MAGVSRPWKEHADIGSGFLPANTTTTDIHLPAPLYLGTTSKRSILVQGTHRVQPDV
jgi:hypothetical protein